MWWKPEGVLTWQWQLSGVLNMGLDVQVYDVDGETTTAAQVAQLKARGVKTIAYFDTSYEPGRSDSARLAPHKCGAYAGWPGQYWLDQRSSVVRAVMVERMARYAAKGFDAVEADSIDAVSNNCRCNPTLRAADQLDFIKFLATEAHKLGLGFGLKNTPQMSLELREFYDFIVIEEALKYQELGDYREGAGNKPLFLCEYPARAFSRGKPTASGLAKFKTLKVQADKYQASLIVKRLALDAPRIG